MEYIQVEMKNVSKMSFNFEDVRSGFVYTYWRRNRLGIYRRFECSHTDAFTSQSLRVCHFDRIRINLQLHYQVKKSGGVDCVLKGVSQIRQPI